MFDVIFISTSMLSDKAGVCKLSLQPLPVQTSNVNVISPAFKRLLLAESELHF